MRSCSFCTKKYGFTPYVNTRLLHVFDVSPESSKRIERIQFRGPRDTNFTHPKLS